MRKLQEQIILTLLAVVTIPMTLLVMWVYVMVATR